MSELNLQKAYEDYAEKVNRSVDDLSIKDKQAAVLGAILSEDHMSEKNNEVILGPATHIPSGTSSHTYEPDNMMGIARKWDRRMRFFRFLRERVHLMWMTIGFLLASMFWFILFVAAWR